MKRTILLISLLALALTVVRVEGETTYSIGIYYVDTGPTFNPDWRTLVDQGMSYAIPRLDSFFTDQGIRWTYTSIKSVSIAYTLVPDQYGNLPSGLYNTIPLIFEASPSLEDDYKAHDLFIFLYAGDFSGAYSYDYHGPMYASEGMFRLESATLTLIEHETLHPFGLRDHNQPHVKNYYDDCIMGNLNLGTLSLCPDSRLEFDQGSLGKEPLESLVPSLRQPDDVVISPDIPEAPGPQSPVEGLRTPRLPLTLLVIVPLILFLLLIRGKTRFF